MKSHKKIFLDFLKIVLCVQGSTIYLKGVVNVEDIISKEIV